MTPRDNYSRRKTDPNYKHSKNDVRLTLLLMDGLKPCPGCLEYFVAGEKVAVILQEGQPIPYHDRYSCRPMRKAKGYVVAITAYPRRKSDEKILNEYKSHNHR